ncbi:amidohydrolase [Natrarchaeobius halalkaliphilus]|uniref:Amidohydrolase n=1 Tax=Natrarchaeobius halalkaliphilus TaxID=1679091 RepID=A0A3N6M0C7_9EURY|nr:M20/M25/M40 family metallo-hydrolase [Natrarchaeobius halalkaliphilus]RQG87994.1 amidohydrolase [Natrarchaeobius halalkaliphilus]
MAAFSEPKAHAVDWVDRNSDQLSTFEQRIWEYAEPAWREYRSADAYADLLEEEGFEVERGSAGMPTAFVATYGDGDPVIATYAEYDAVPGNSQRRVPYREPREGLHEYAPGHTDPHSILGVGSLGGALAAKDAIDEYDLDGTIRFFGEPAEKVCGSKPIHATKGYFDDHDAHLSYHPYPTNTTVWETHCGSYWSVVFEFECEEPHTWTQSNIVPDASPWHADARAPGALDALCLMYTNTKYTKEAMFPHTGHWILNEYVMTAGQKTSDNLAPRISQIQYCWRAPTLDLQQRIYEVLRQNAEHAAGVSHCSLSETWVAKTRVGLANNAMAAATYDNLEAIGPPTLDEAAREFGRDVQETLEIEPMENPFNEGAETLVPPEEYEETVRSGLPDWQQNFTSDDYVDYTWHAPTVRLYTGRPWLRPPSDDYSYPEWAYNAVGGVPEITHPGMFVASKTIAATIVDLLTKPSVLEQARDEFERRTGGGVGGSDWVEPLLPASFDAPVDLPWPEYVETPRGREWMLPTRREESTAGDVPAARE